jgi:hypothetical protein
MSVSRATTPFVSLTESTIACKGLGKALIDIGFLTNALTQKIMADKAFVGVLRGTINRPPCCPGYGAGWVGKDMVNIGAVMEYGATIHPPSSATIILPRCPFLHPVMEQYRDEIMENYRKAIHATMK